MLARNCKGDGGGDDGRSKLGSEKIGGDDDGAGRMILKSAEYSGLVSRRLMSSVV